MNTNAILNFLLSRKGQFSSIRYNRECKTLKNCNFSIRKETVVTIRSGIDYSNIQRVIEEREKSPKESYPLPWGEWKAFPYLITHKGVDYARLYTVNDSASAKVRYLVNNQEVSFNEIEKYLQSSEKQDKTDLRCFTVKMNDIEEMI